jgi:hypothetical protein
LGWWPWLVLALAGAGLLMLSALHAAVAPGSRAGVDLARAANTGEVLSFAPAGRE